MPSRPTSPGANAESDPSPGAALKRGVRPFLVGALCAVVLAGGTAASAVSPQTSPEPAKDTTTEAAVAGKGKRAARKLEKIALPLGLQTARKRTTRPKQKVAGTVMNAPNPYLALVPELSKVDYSFWKAKARRQAERRVQPRAVNPFLYDEQEPAEQIGSNDAQANAETIPGFGLGAGEESAVRISGELAAPRGIRSRRIKTREDQGSIRIATRTRIPGRTKQVLVSSRIGDGPHGSKGTGRGDFDFFKVRARAGETISVKMLRQTDFDTVVVVYDADGEIVAFNDDTERSLRSALDFRVDSGGAYYVMATGFISLPRNPFRSGSGTGRGDEGDYRMRITVAKRDMDFYAFELDAGDVLGGKVEGSANNIQVFKFDGEERIGSGQNASFIYPMASPLPGGGNGTLAHVVEEAGLYAVAADQGTGRYDATFEVYRPGTEQPGGLVTQRIFLDFDGERVNTGMWGGFGVSDLSPLSSFLARWKLDGDQLDAVIDQVVATVEENVNADLASQGLNDDFQVEILNSRDHADPFGEPNVSRVIVGGTILESGLPTIGIAQSIDPGNYEREETALVLLDILSDPDRRNDASLNSYLRASSDRVGFVGTAVGNVVSHEIGHYIGSFHVDQFNDVDDLMDQGGNFAVLFGVGPDGIGGTADDKDVDFGIDAYNPFEGFAGYENTLNNSAWASSGD